MNPIRSGDEFSAGHHLTVHPPQTGILVEALD